MTRTLSLVLSGLLFCACGDDATVTDTGPSPDVSEGSDAGPVDTDAGPGDSDAGPGDSDAGPGDTDAGPVDVDGGPVETDAGPVVADAGPLCLFNSECPDETACVGDESGSYCVPGERGSVEYGEPCTTSEECASAVCLEDFCTMLCEAVDACTSDNLPRCHPALGYCTPAAED